MDFHQVAFALPQNRYINLIFGPFIPGISSTQELTLNPPRAQSSYQRRKRNARTRKTSSV